MFFPEGTRSRDTTLGQFHDGAFHLAITAGVSVLPVVIDGSSPCLPRNTWKFGPPADINVRVLSPAPTSGMTAADAPRLREQVRSMIQAQLDEWHAGRTAGMARRDSSDRSSV
jgi:1-acyl-sn-glycerol-3-phosphate acyltransferase